MTNYLLVPGLGNSGPEHWQTYYESLGEHFYRIYQQEWETPICRDWIETIERQTANFDLSTFVFVGHSLGCLAIMHWIKKYHRCIKGALLVAPCDIEVQPSDFPAQGFAPIPLERLPFKTIVVASENDPWASLQRSTYFAHHWGSQFVNIGKAGHINASSGHQYFKEGLELLKQFG